MGKARFVEETPVRAMRAKTGAPLLEIVFEGGAAGFVRTSAMAAQRVAIGKGSVTGGATVHAAQRRRRRLSVDKSV